MVAENKHHIRKEHGPKLWGFPGAEIGLFVIMNFELQIIVTISNLFEMNYQSFLNL